jgi:Aromatic acid exporter family member 2
MIASSLRTGCPLPQITPCPLLDRFLLQYHGLNVIHKDAGEDYGLPRSITFETLKNEQYLSVTIFFLLFERTLSHRFLVCSLWELPQRLQLLTVLIN